jgi:hypothetical protein
MPSQPPGLLGQVEEAIAHQPVDEKPAEVPTQLQEPVFSESEALPLSEDRTPTNNQQPITHPTSEQAGLKVLDAIATTRRSTLLIGDTGSGKSVTQAYILNKLFELHPNAEVFVLSQKADSFCGLAEKGRVTLFDPTEPGHALILIHNIWCLYDMRRRLPESERPALPASAVNSCRLAQYQPGA